MIDKATIDAISTWVDTEDVGGLDQWLDKLQRILPVAGEHGLKPFESYVLFFQIAQLYKLCNIRDLLKEMIDNDVGRGDTPHA